MKLSALGALAFLLGLVLGVEGLVITGVLWLCSGLLLRTIAPPRRPKGEPALPTGAADEPDAPRASRRTVVMAVVVVVVGGASIALGLGEVGFGELDRPWRWVPIIGGALMAVPQVVAGVLYAIGAGITAATETIGVPDHPATITVISVEETGVRINDKPQLAFELFVEPDGHPAYELSKRMTVGFIDLGKVRPGTTYRGQVDLDSPKAIAVDWHSGVDERIPDPRTRLLELDGLLRDGLITPEEHAAARGRILGSL